jgi:hypothetical protein
VVLGVNPNMATERKRLAENGETGEVGLPATTREVGTRQPANRVKVVRTGTLEPAHADGPKRDDSCDERDVFGAMKAPGRKMRGGWFSRP